jgi:hypothetical protein
MQIDTFIKKDASKDEVQKRFHDISRAVNGGLEFGSPSVGLKNQQGYWLDVVTPNVADTEFTVNHNLQYVPTGIIVFSVDKAAIVYASRRAEWTTTQAFFKVNQASVSLVGFIT